MRLAFLGLGLSLALCLQGGFAMASILPPSAEPGRYDQEFDPQALPEFKEPPAKEIVVEKPAPVANVEEEGFYLSAIIVKGSTVYTEEDLVPLYQDMLPEKITFAELRYIADLMTAKYRNEGYILSKVVIPPQEAVDGIVYFNVVEGKVDRVLAPADQEKLEGLLAAYAQKISDPEITNIKELERYLLLMNDVPGVEVKGTLLPAKIAAASDVHIRAKQKKLAAKVTLDNWGTRYLGPLQASVYGVANNVLGFNEESSLRIVKTARSSDLRYLEFGEKIPLGTEGTTLAGRFKYSRSSPGSDLEDLEVKSRNTNFAATLRHPFIRARTHNLSGWATFEHQNSRVRSFGSKLSEDRLRLARLGMMFDWIDSYQGANMATLEVTYGLDLFGASQEGQLALSRVRGVPTEFVKTTLDLARLQKVTDDISVLAYLSGQFSSHALLASEEFGFGGPSFGRGYDPSEITGDHGFAIKMEAQYNGQSEWDWLDQYQLFTFYDYGMVFNKDHRVEEPLYKTAASAGMGLRAYFENNLSGSLEVAKPLTRTVLSQGENQKNPNVYIRLGADF